MPVITEDEEVRKTHPDPPKSIPRPIRTVACNMMSYIDGEGARKQIWIPKGTLSTASKHFENKEWDALAKFPTWGKFTFSLQGLEIETWWSATRLLTLDL